MRTLLVFFCAIIINSVTAEKIVTCYYGTWATYRSGLGKFDVSDVNVDLCSHLIYTFVGINNMGNVISLDSFLDFETGKDNFRQFNALKQKNPKLKTLLAVGGWNEGSYKYSVMAANPTLRQNFIGSALQMVLSYGFDGFDIDWEYPNKRDTAYGTADIENFTQLLKEMRAQFDFHGLMLTAAVSATKESASGSYDIAAISQYLDFIGLMTYDLRGVWDSVTGHNAALHMSEGDSGDREDQFTVDVAIEFWLAQGCPPEKLLLGVPFYGRTFTLASADASYVGAPAVGAGLSGPFTLESGFLGYNEFCVMLQSEPWDKRRDHLGKVPYAVKDRNWVSYDDPQSIKDKVNYSKSLGLAGIMIWSIETDDFHGQCGEKYGLLKAIQEAFEDNNETTIVATTPSIEVTTVDVELTTVDVETATVEGTTTKVETTTLPAEEEETIAAEIPEVTESNVASNEPCKEEGPTSNPKDCASFIICSEGEGGKLIANVIECPKSLLWDSSILSCNYAQSVTCAV